MASITFEEAVIRAVRSFYEGGGFENYEKLKGKPMKYNIDYFDELEGSYRKRKPSPEMEEDEEEEDLELDEDEEDFE